VPADSAIIGITDRIFTRIGAHDNLRAAQSTFMVEMLETAHILHNATEKSLVILDEVGRGTSPEDGFALAWAVAESLAEGKKGLVLFATHFHALKDLAQTLPHVFNSHLAVSVDEDDLIFLRKMVPQATDRSYGIVVAEKAGIPKPIIERAQEMAEKSPTPSLRGEGPQSDPSVSSRAQSRDLSTGALSLPNRDDTKNSHPEGGATEGILAHTSPASAGDSSHSFSMTGSNQLALLSVEPQASAIEQKIKDLNINNLTPLQALTLLNDFYNQLNK
jgi:DNA mismatch repair ATPase MutS